MIARWTAATMLVAMLAAPVAAKDAPLQDRVATVLREKSVPGTRFGLVVTTEDGRDIVAIAPDDRFVPASNAKLFTTAAAYRTLPGVDAPDETGGATVRLERGRGAPDVVLTGNGDARLSSAPGCVTDCLATLADAVAAATRVAHDVIGDDSLFPDERWGPGMSWNNIATRYGTGISALTLDDNEAAIVVAPGPGAVPQVTGSSYYAIDNRALTTNGEGAGGKAALAFGRMPGSRSLHVTGTIPRDASPQTLRVGIDDPAEYAAWRLRRMLVERGVRVTGSVVVRHRPLSDADDPVKRGTAPVARPPLPAALAKLTPPPLADDIRATNKTSQNLHAELLLRRLGRITGSGAIADGQAVVARMLADAGVPRTAYDFADGSGMSNYDRLSPRAAVTFLRWTQAQPWGAAWRATFPVGGVDGTLRKRFAGTPLDGKLFAKTGSLDKASALSGFLVARSGRTLVFSIFANDMPADASALPAIDAALLLIAAEN